MYSAFHMHSRCLRLQDAKAISPIRDCECSRMAMCSLTAHVPEIGTNLAFSSSSPPLTQQKQRHLEADARAPVTAGARHILSPRVDRMPLYFKLKSRAGVGPLTSSVPGRTPPIFTEFGPDSPQIGPDFGCIRPKLVPGRLSLVRIRPTFAPNHSQTRPALERHWPDFDKISGPISADIGPESSQIGWMSAKFCPKSARLCQVWPRLARHRPNLVRLSGAFRCGGAG